MWPKKSFLTDLNESGKRKAEQGDLIIFRNLNIVSTGRVATKLSGFYQGLKNRKLVSSATERDYVNSKKHPQRFYWKD